MCVWVGGCVAHRFQDWPAELEMLTPSLAWCVCVLLVCLLDRRLTKGENRTIDRQGRRKRATHTTRRLELLVVVVVVVLFRFRGDRKWRPHHGTHGGARRTNGATVSGVENLI